MSFAKPPSQNAKWHVVLRFLRISCPEVFCKKAAFKFFKKMPLLESLFNDVAGPQARRFIKKRPQHRRFPANFEKFLRTSFFPEYLRWLLLIFHLEF